LWALRYSGGLRSPSI